MRYFRSVLLYSLLFFLTFACTRKTTAKMTLNAEVYYVMKDSFLGEGDNCRVLLNIPIENGAPYEVGANLILCLKISNRNLAFSHVLKDKRDSAEYYLNATVVGQFKDGEVAVVPSFSPLSINKELLAKVKYVKGKTSVLDVKVEASQNRDLKLVDVKLNGYKDREPIVVK